MGGADRALARRNLILDLLAQNKLISMDDANRAKAMPLGLVNGSGAASNYYPAFLDFVRRTLHRDYKDADLTEAGLTIFTTLDPAVVDEELARLDA